MADKISVLIVDDSEDIRIILSLKLSRDARFDVVGEAADGRQAVELTKQLRPDVVLLDVGMPAMDGFEALALIRSSHPDIKVAILSGFPADALADTARDRGADLYLEKDVSTLGSLGDKLVSLVAARA